MRKEAEGKTIVDRYCMPRLRGDGCVLRAKV